MIRKYSTTLVALVLLGASANAQIKVFVDQSVTDPLADGTTWGLAYSNLQPAIDDVLSLGQGGRILVAQGTYEPENMFGGGTHSHKTYVIDGTCG
jgi:hypothetical protein